MAKDEAHARIYHSMIESGAFRAASGNAVKLLVVLTNLEKENRKTHKSNNGSIFLSVRQAAEWTGLHPSTVVAAFRELDKLGFIKAVQRGHFDAKGGQATTWRLTWKPVAGTGPPTNDFLQWTPQPGSRAERRATSILRCGIAENAVRDFSTEVASSLAVEGATDRKNRTVDGKAGSGAVRNCSTHAITTGGQAARERRASTWQCERAREMIGNLYSRGNVGTQRKLALRSQVSESTLSRFRSRPKGTLPEATLRRVMGVVSEMNDELHRRLPATARSAEVNKPD